MPDRVAIVGGGITGLAAAYHLERFSDAEIDLYEASNRLGGKLATGHFGDFLVEFGPDCFFCRKPGTLDFIRELGLEEDLVEPLQNEFSLLIDGALHRVPAGLVTFSYSSPEAVHRASFLSDAVKARVLDEPNQPAGAAEDESIRAFFTRRFGPEFSRLVAETLLAGTHGGDPDRLSMRALFPAYFDLERKHGSLTAATRPPAPGPSFLSFRGGMQTLVGGLVRSLSRTRIHLKYPIGSLNELAADRVLVATPANAAATLVGGEAARLLSRIEHRTTTIITLAFPRAQIAHSLEGTGFLVPPSMGGSVTGATWSSEKWPGRAPADQALLRVFLRGEADENGWREIAPVLGISGEPTFFKATRWRNAQPQYEVGHLDLVSEIESKLLPVVRFAGTSYDGVGIPDCLRQGRDTAHEIIETL